MTGRPRWRRADGSIDWQAHGEDHALSRYDPDQFAALTRIRNADRPLVVFARTGRLFHTEPAPGRGLLGLTVLTVVAEDTSRLVGVVASLLSLDLIEGDRCVRVLDLDGQQRTAHVLTLTARGRDIRDLADRIGYGR